MSDSRLQLSIGRMPAEDTWWLCISDMDSTEINRVAQFTSEDHMIFFTEFMKTQGYLSTPLSTDREINQLFED